MKDSAKFNLAPPALLIDTRSRQGSEASKFTLPSSAESTLSNPFLTPNNSSAENNPFAFSPGLLNKLLNPKSLSVYKALGGLKGLERGLQTDIHSGLSLDETNARKRISFKSAHEAHDSGTEIPADPRCEPYTDRKRIYGKNVLPEKKATPLWLLMWKAYNDKVLILLTVAAIISLALGLYETLGVDHPAGSPPPVDWVEGVAICVAIIIVVGVGSINDWQKERAFTRLNAKKDDREIKVVRSGKTILINVRDVLAGDMVHLEPGDLIPVDGILIQGHDLCCDESSATGESDAIKKTSGEQVDKILESEKEARSTHMDPFIISGAKVLEGMGTFLCTSVGVNSSFGKIMMSVRTPVEATPLQKKLEKLAGAIAKLGASAALLLFMILLIRFLASLPSDTRDAASKASSFMDILIVAITIIVVAVPEGLPLAVTLALAFATTRMLKENNLVRVLRACETMGNATTICSDKTGTLTTNKMTVVTGTFDSSSFTKAESSGKTISQWASELSAPAKKVIVQSVAINSTAFEGEDAGQFAFIGSKTETALLQLAREHLGMQSLAQARTNEFVVQMFPFDSKKKCMGAVINLGNGHHRLLVKGASEILLEYCSSKVSINDLSVSAMSEHEREAISTTIGAYARQSLRTIALVYRDYDEWPPANASAEDGQVVFSSVLREMVFLGVVGIQDPVRPGVPESVKQAREAGVTIRMVTGDNAVTARAIAEECGILDEEGIVVEGPIFRELSHKEMDYTIPKLRVLARSSPEDKKILVARLKHLGETVAVTGDGTNDAPALKAADVGFSMGISGTEVAKEASEIILMDDNFTSIITAMKWGRAVNDAFQITVNITAVLLAFVSAVSDPEMQSVLTAVQLLWVNLIMDTFAALALATDPPTEKILERPPQPKHAPLITTNMWKMITGQSIFQLAVTFVLYFAGSKIFPSYSEAELRTIVFNTFVWMQIFNEFNNRRLDNKFNIFEGLQRNHFFIIINCLMVGLQITIIFVGGEAFSIVSGGITGPQWAICLVLSFISIPWAVAIRLFPDELFERIATFVGHPVVILFRHKKGVHQDEEAIAGRGTANVDASFSNPQIRVENID
ncbi:plasma membrane calcium-transporting ATPase 2 [Cryphonectria parasitica EP155]|uniref:Calcium-transporting ATPase n=1 Tax=Cryphonectria parasitica (strain ATCC 38755 / EP155) TaxID=660469 RepID=A0A9P4YCY0_CRYP1|nr:plasma membrane calcium-transporting ATPase 2 [Cryphonectria parasitica EP155]KAF3770592.1 plasma membrane calcium-transporting ATPase 2 [Cryphonectria parasitica EP155]